MKELLKRIRGFPNYFVSNKGRVWSEHRHKYLKLQKGGGSGKYSYVHLYCSNKQKVARVGRLVATYFIGAPSNKNYEVNFRDGDKENNDVRNLIWAKKHSKTMHRAKRKGFMAHGERSGSAKLSENEVRAIRRRFKTGKYLKYELANKYNISPSTCGCIIRRKSWRHI